MNLTALFDEYFSWWQSAAAQYLRLFQNTPFFFQGMKQTLGRYLEAKKAADRILDETWRNLRLPSMEEVIRIHERLNHLESLLAHRKESDERDVRREFPSI